MVINTMSKSIFKSKTFYVAVVQLLLAGVALYMEVLPNYASYGLMIKSLLDVWLRMISNKPVKVL